MKKNNVSMPVGHVVHGSFYQNHSFENKSGKDDSLFISFCEKMKCFVPKTIKWVIAEKCYLPDFGFWNQILYPITTI